MKVRIIFWTMMTVLIAVTGAIVWIHFRPVPSSVAIATVNHSQTITTPAVNAITHTVQPVPQSVASTVSTGQEPSSVAKTIVNEQADYWQRHEAIQSLISGKLDDVSRQSIYGFLRQHNATDDQQSGQVLKNQLLDALCEMQPPPQGLGELLQQVYADQSQNIVLRDYAVQHMVAYYRQMGASAGVDNQTRSDELQLVQQTLWQALANTDTSIAGTALIGMSHLSQEGWSGFDAKKVGGAALTMANDANAGELSKITAIQVCASLGVQDALPVVLDAAQQGDDDPVKISAIGALGSLGGKDEIVFLNNVLGGSDDRLKAPAQAALDRINGRLKQQARLNHGNS